MEAQVTQLDQSTPILEAQIDYRQIQMKSSDYVLNSAKALYREWNEMQPSQKRAIAETFTEYINIGQDNINIAFSYLPVSAQTSQRNFNESTFPIKINLPHFILAFIPNYLRFAPHLVPPGGGLKGNPV